MKSSFWYVIGIQLVSIQFIQRQNEQETFLLEGEEDGGHSTKSKEKHTRESNKLKNINYNKIKKKVKFNKKRHTKEGKDTIKMKVVSKLLQYVHLDKNYSLLSGRNLKVIYDFFMILDVHGENALNDVQFCAFLKSITDLTSTQIYKVSIAVISFMWFSITNAPHFTDFGKHLNGSLSN